MDQASASSPPYPHRPPEPNAQGIAMHLLIHLAGLMLIYALFALLPAVLLGMEYNGAVGVAYFFGASTLLAIFHAAVDIKDELKARGELYRKGDAATP